MPVSYKKHGNVDFCEINSFNSLHLKRKKALKRDKAIETNEASQMARKYIMIQWPCQPGQTGNKWGAELETRHTAY